MASLAFDHDLRFEEPDRDRFRALWGESPAGVEVTVEEEEGERLAAPVAAALLAAPAVRLAPRRGLWISNALALAATVALAGWSLSRQLGREGAAGLLLCCLAGSVALHAPFTAEPDLLVALLLVAALVLAVPAGEPSRGRLPEVYDGDFGRPRGRRRARLGVAGLLAGLAVASDLTLLPFVPALGALEEPGRRRSAALFTGLAAGVALVAVAATSGAPWGWPEPEIAPSLLAWNGLFALVGRHAGALIWFLPMVGLAAAAAGGGRWPILTAAVAALGLRLLLHPFSWAGGGSGPAALALLPLFAALWLGPVRPLGPLALVALTGLAGLWLWPLWLAPRAGDPAFGGGAEPGRTLLRHLPVETSLRQLPGAVDREQAGVAVRLLPPVVDPAEDGELRLAGDREERLVVASRQRLVGLRLEFEARAPSEVRVVGAQPGNTVFHPGGGVGFELLLDRPARRHRSPWGPGEALFYPLAIGFDRGPAVPLRFRLAQARPAVPAPEERR